MNVTELDTCPIWRTPARFKPYGLDRFEVDSPRAGGKYAITSTEMVTVGNLDEAQRASLTSWFVRNRAMGNLLPTASYANAQGLSPLSVPQRADLLLRFIESRIPNIGQKFEFENHYHQCIQANIASPSWQCFANMLAWSESHKFAELLYLLEYLQHREWLGPKAYSAIGQKGYYLTVAGYQHLSEFEDRVSGSTQAFVAMWFDKSMDKAWEAGIQPAIVDAGYEPVRIDKKEHLNKIDDEIIAEIRRSRFLVADFTEDKAGPRGSVYYEAGFAHGLDIQVIFTCRNNSFEKIHFDTRPYPFIVWKTPEELRERLSKRISAVLGDGPRI